MKKRKHFWSNPWVLVVGTVCITSITDQIFGIGILKAIWNFLKNLFTSIFDFLDNSIHIQIWVLILIPVLSIGLIVFTFYIISRIQDRRNISGSGANDLLNYRRDTFDDILYRWDYSKMDNGQYMMTRIEYFCPKCVCQIVRFQCPKCGENLGHKMKSEDEVRSLVRNKFETE